MNQAALPFREVFRVHAPFVWRVLLRFGVQQRDLDDVCQEVFIVVHRRLPEFEGRASVRTWIYEIARRSAWAHRRHSQNRPELLTTTEVESVDPREGPEHEVAGNQALAWLECALRELDEDKREAFVLYELEEMTLAEVAAAVGSPINTVHYRINVARDALRAKSQVRAQPMRSARAVQRPEVKELP